MDEEIDLDDQEGDPDGDLTMRAEEEAEVLQDGHARTQEGEGVEIRKHERVVDEVADAEAEEVAIARGEELAGGDEVDDNAEPEVDEDSGCECPIKAQR